MQKNKVPFCVLQKKRVVCSHAIGNGLPEEVIYHSYVVAAFIEILYPLLHMFAIPKIKLIIFPFLQKTVHLGSGWTQTTFEKSVPMSTYLVCFAVHQFQWTERISASGKRVSSVAA